MWDNGFNNSVMDATFDIFPVIFFLVFCFIIFCWIKNIILWSKDNKQPKIPVEATVIGKRADVSCNHNNVGTSYTDYYISFEFSNGERGEFKVRSTEYALLREGDFGILTVQGTRYVSFERK